MPIYEYTCPDCRQRVNLFFRSFEEAGLATPACPVCQGGRLKRLVSRVAVLKSEESRMDSLADPALLGGLESEDPRALATFMRQMSNETGEPMDAEMNEVIGRMESGENLDSIENSLSDSAESDGGNTVADE